MDARLVPTALVVAAFVVAGCGSLPGGLDRPGTETTTVTPVPVPTVTGESESLPPGVTSDAIRNANALFESHHTFLEGQSYTLYVLERTDDVVSEHLFRVDGSNTYHRYVSLDPRRQTIVTFADGESVYDNSTFAGVRSYARRNATNNPSSLTVKLSRAYLRLDDVEVTDTQVDGDRYYEISGEYGVHPHAEHLENFSVRAVVSPEGFVRSMNASYTLSRDGSTTNVTRHFEYSDVGSTTVERPEWVADRWDVNATRTSTSTAGG